MEKMKSIARKLDVFFRICQICVLIAAIAAGVALVLIAASFLFHLDPDVIGSGYHELEIGFLKLALNEGYFPSEQTVLIISAAGLLMSAALTMTLFAFIGCIRKILLPMKAGMPFANTHVQLRHLAIYVLVLGALANVSNIIELYLVEKVYHLTELFVSEKVSSVIVQYDFNAAFIAISAVLLLLSYIFRYGEALQTLSDETL